MTDAIFQLDKTLEGLKDFQEATVEAVQKHFDNPKHSNRVLVADEVGLGKTIVAKGVIAEMLKSKLHHLTNEHQEVLKVTYICSNLTLANENKKKLAVFKGEFQKQYVAEPTFGRLVELAIEKKFQRNKETLLEVNSLTPSTSFKLTSGHGNRWERFIIYQMLMRDEKFTFYDEILSEVFRDGVIKDGPNGWDSLKPFFDQNYSFNEDIFFDFTLALEDKLSLEQLEYLELENGTLGTILEAYCRKEITIPRLVRLRTLLRVALAKSCAKNLKADLFILDEFQRFQSLLDTNNENEESLIAREIFKKKDNTKVLLLSATPFKALSRLDEDEQNEAHLDELRKLLKFLSDYNIGFIDSYEKERDELLKQILSLRDTSMGDMEISSEHKEAVEKLLSSYICRTERSQISQGFDDVFQSKMFECNSTFSNDEIKSFLDIDQLGQTLSKHHPGRYGSQLLEFYKAAPWALSFLSGYQFKKHLDAYRQDKYIKNAVKKSSRGWLPRKDIQNYSLNIVDSAPNAKLRALMDTFFGTKGEEMLWVPPSMPYYPLSGSFKGSESFTKSLLFSSWALVPRALSGLISYEAERRIVQGNRNSDYFNKMHNPRLRFEGDVSLDIWGLVYPSRSLRDMPLEFGSISVEDILEERTELFEEKLSGLNHYNEEIESRYWYALAPMLLDVLNGHKAYLFEWLESEERKAQETSKIGRYEHLQRLRSELEKHLEVKYIPSDLSYYLAQLSIAGPGVCFARMSENYWPENKINFTYTSDMVISTVSLFNKAESEMILEKKYPHENKYWQMVLNYCIEGNFQAMIDEYAHLLATSGLTLEQTSERFQEVLGIRPVSVSCQFREDRNRITRNTTLRCHYAIPLGNQKMADAKGVQRVGTVRDTFNSPFRPFVLNSTSIGQEGLDFHWYCSRVIHWNLPTNPIDIEQREGRVNRYKSLVVRRRVKEIYSSELINTNYDVWSELFEKANEGTKEKRKSDLVPYWHLTEGSAVIERIIPMMPMSKEVSRIREALKILSLYRLAFGQPRQEELLSNLLECNMSKSEIERMTRALVINLAPLIHREKDFH